MTKIITLILFWYEYQRALTMFSRSETERGGRTFVETAALAA